jgi:large subunit ribosomal protein L3
MTIGLVGQKCGMTRIFTEEGVSIPVTVIEAAPNRITQIKTTENDGYSAIQVTSGSIKSKRISKSMAGHFAAANVEAGKLNNEFRYEHNDNSVFEIGSEIRVDVFQEGQKVDVIGKTIGKGFAGTVKRHNFSMQDATHGNSISHRAPGSIGQNQTPGRVFKGKKMAGHMGNVKRTMQNLEVVKIDLTRNLILVKGAVPGHKGSKVIVQFAVKHDYQGFEIKVHSSDAEQESKEIQNNETDADIKTETPAAEAAIETPAAEEAAIETPAAEEAVTETPAAETSTKTTDTDGSKEPKKSD